LRHGIKVGLIALGAVVSVATLNRTTTFLPDTSLVHRLLDRDSDLEQRPSTLSKAVLSTASHSGELDIGVQHARIDFWVKQLSTTLSSGFETALGRKDKYEGMIGAKLAAKQMPRDLIYLAMIESQFDPSAKSPVSAVGMWQFMSATARRFGLTVRGRVDERKDPARATDAAVAYLSNLHDRFGSWYLAAAAYNSGEGTVLRALQKVTGRSEGTDEDFFKILPALPKETQDYVPKLIASARIGNDPAKYGITARPAIELASVATNNAVVGEVSTASNSHVQRSAKPMMRTSAKVSRSNPRRSHTTAPSRRGRRPASTR
jgi:hypothetical protein